MKVPNSKYNIQCLNLKMIAEGNLHYFSNKHPFDDKLKVSCPAGVDNYYFAGIVLRQIHVPFLTLCRISLMSGVREQMTSF